MGCRLICSALGRSLCHKAPVVDFKILALHQHPEVRSAATGLEVNVCSQNGVPGRLHLSAFEVLEELLAVFVDSRRNQFPGGHPSFSTVARPDLGPVVSFLQNFKPVAVLEDLRYVVDNGGGIQHIKRWGSDVLQFKVISGSAKRMIVSSTDCG